jgi:trehalose 6-phosphate phosphatase
MSDRLRLMGLPESLTATGVQTLEAILRSPSETLIASDFDGTLAPIVEDPEQAYSDPRAVGALGRLGEYVGSVVVITGRPTRSAVRLGRFREVAGLHSMIVLGQYGVERWNAADDEYLLPPAPPQINTVAEELPKILDSLGLADARIEDKGRAIAVHTRSLRDPKAALAKLAGPLDDLASRRGLVSTPGKYVWEIRAPGMDKGAALRAIVEETAARQVIFAGDDLGDLPAFQAVRELATAGVMGLLVCSASTEEDALTGLSDVLVDGPAGLAEWLTELADRLQSRT